MPHYYDWWLFWYFHIDIFWYFHAVIISPLMFSLADYFSLIFFLIDKIPALSSFQLIFSSPLSFLLRHYFFFAADAEFSLMLSPSLSWLLLLLLSPLRHYAIMPSADTPLLTFILADYLHYAYWASHDISAYFITPLRRLIDIAFFHFRIISLSAFAD